MSAEKTEFRGFDTLGRAFQFVFANIPHLLSTAALTIFVIILYDFFIAATLGNTLAEQVAAIMLAAESDPMAAISAYGDLLANPTLWGSLVISIVFGGMFAIRWHRSALYGNDADNTGLGIEFSANLLSYIWRGFLISLICIGVSIAASLVGGLLVGLLVGISASISTGAAIIVGAISSVLIVLVILIPMAYIFARFSLALPAAALDIPNFGLGASWKATKGHGLGIAGIYVLLVIALAIFAIIMQIIVGFAVTPFMGSGSGLLGPDPTLGAEALGQMMARDIWVGSIANIFILPITLGVSTSLFSYIYFQLGRAPDWVEGDGGQ